MDTVLLKPTPAEIQLHKYMQKPLQKNAGLFVHVKRLFSDVNGALLLKTDPSIPPALLTNYPFWMFGEFDRLGGYRVGNQINPPLPGTFYVTSFVNGVDTPFLFGTGLNTVQNFINVGDVVHIFTDNLNAPSTYVWIIQHCDSASLGSVYANATAPENQKIDIEGINYFAYTAGDPVKQFSQNINLTRMDVLGTYVNQPFPPTGFYQIDDKQAYFIRIPLKTQVDQYNLISSYIDFTIDDVQLSLLLKKNTIKV